MNNTYIVSGGDITSRNLTLSAAEAVCSTLPDCAGFTYRADASPGGPSYDMLFKSVAQTGGGAGWVAAIKATTRIFSSTFTPHAVLQHDFPCVWGWGGNVTGAAVTVTTDADGGVPHSTTVQANNTWRICLPPQTPGAPFTLNASVAGLGAQSLEDVAFGEVWVASGQCVFFWVVGRQPRPLPPASGAPHAPQPPPIHAHNTHTHTHTHTQEQHGNDGFSSV